ncbi:MAG TPA: FG-GAP repeat protein, partial [Leptospiraceae bacterium]|nr:FG-GAP repeat protein [Leptospiraceae bacterium]
YTGDFNGDGYRDMAVSAYGYFTNSGAVYIFHSAGSSGITAGSPTGADTVLTGSSTNDNFGAALSEH